jgi:polyphenol oxidase
MRYTTSKIEDGNMDFRFGETSVVLKSRELFLAKNSLDASRCVAMRVVHGDDIRIVTTADLGKGMYDEPSALVCDALITQEKNLGLFLLTADCMPCVFFDPTHGVLGLAHLGWKGVALGLAAKVIAQMEERYGTVSKQLQVHFGPSIAACSYITESPAQATDPTWGPFLRPADTGGTHVDLFGYVQAQLIAAGVFASNITHPSADTAANVEYFSHYRSRKTGEPEGRIATVALIS